MRETGKLGVQSCHHWDPTRRTRYHAATGKAECLERAIIEENPSSWLTGTRTGFKAIGADAE